MSNGPSRKAARSTVSASSMAMGELISPTAKALREVMPLLVIPKGVEPDY